MTDWGDSRVEKVIDIDLEEGNGISIRCLTNDSKEPMHKKSKSNIEVTCIPKVYLKNGLRVFAKIKRNHPV